MPGPYGLLAIDSAFCVQRVSHLVQAAVACSPWGPMCRRTSSWRVPRTEPEIWSLLAAAVRSCCKSSSVKLGGGESVYPLQDGLAALVGAGVGNQFDERRNESSVRDIAQPGGELSEVHLTGSETNRFAEPGT